MLHRLDKHNPQIYTTGAYLRPLQVKNTDGEEFWIWTVEQFEDDTYKSGNIYNPNIIANSLEQLIEEITE